MQITSSVEIRPAIPGDEAQIVDVNGASLNTDYVFDERGLTAAYWAARTGPLWRAEKAAFFFEHLSELCVAEVEEAAIVGFGMAADDECAAIYVLNSFRGQLIGTMLMERFLQLCIDRGHSEAWVGVADFLQRSQRFYESCGFVATEAIAPGGHNNRPEFFEDVIMVNRDVVESRTKILRRLGTNQTPTGQPVTYQIPILGATNSA